MEKRNLTPILVGQMTRAAQGYRDNWDENKGGVQTIINLYNRLKYAPLENSNDLYKLINDTANFIFEMHTGGGATLTGKHGREMEIDMEMATKLFKKPTGYNELIAAIASFFSGKHEANHGLHKTEVKKFFDIKDGDLVFTDIFQMKINGVGNVYASTEKGQAIYRFLEKVCAAFVDEGLHEIVHVSANISNPQIKQYAPVLVNAIADTLDNIDVSTGKPIVKISGTVDNPSFWGDRNLI